MQPERQDIPWTRTEAHRRNTTAISTISRLLWLSILINAFLRLPDPYGNIVNGIVFVLAFVSLSLLAVEFYGYVFWKPK
jgi:hypothetical protein